MQGFPQMSRSFATSAAVSAAKAPRLLIAGTGWGATSLLKTLTRTRGAREAFDITVVSPRNHMLFTPLLASSAVGTLNFNSIAEPTKFDFPSVSYLPASLTAIDVAGRKVVASGPAEPTKMVPSLTPGASSSSPASGSNASAGVLSVWEGERVSERSYDLLVLAIGARNQTFNIPGVEEHCFFLKELNEARAIRSRIIMNFEAASRPDTPDEDRHRLLSFVICGGGPTGVEFSAELHDFINHDLLALYPELGPYVSITIIEGRQILGAFDASLREYTARKFARDRIKIRTGANVTKVDKHRIHLSDGSSMPHGLAVWNTGIGPRPLIASLDAGTFRKDRFGRLVTDEALRCLAPSSESQPLSFIPGLFALGDCASVLTRDYAATAQVAEQQGKYLGELLLDMHNVVPILPSATTEGNTEAGGDGAKPVIAPLAASSAAGGGSGVEALASRYVPHGPFVYRHGGSLAFLGSYKAISDFTKAEKLPLYGLKLKGWVSFFIWRSAYLTTLGSWRNRMRVPADWLKTMIFGRDTTMY